MLVLWENIFLRGKKMLLMYYLVFPLNYRKSIINEEVGEGLKEIFMLKKAAGSRSKKLQ